MPDTHDAIHEAIKSTWGFDTLRPLQTEAIAAGVESRDSLTVLPTGGGKSLCYQVPPLVTGKASIVISPLIALMRDQVRALELNAYPAAALHSELDLEEASAIQRSLLEGELKLLLVAPERALHPAFKSLVATLADRDQLTSIAIDEAHCISQWGHDFRPEYRRIHELRDVAPNVAMQAFTATATPRVREDIANQLHLRDPEVLVGVFDRPNLTYRVEHRSKPAEQAAEIIRRVTADNPGGAIVYCLSRKDTESLAAQLKELGLDADAYHAGLAAKKRNKVETAFTNETLDVVVATVAFGMGIDRSNVRVVVHATMPKSVEAYQQETGRAGRDGLPAECVMLYSPADAQRWQRLIERSADEYGGDPESTNAQLALIREMRRFAASMGCRHRLLSEHFGQSYTPPDNQTNCQACDVCLGLTEEEPDSVRVAQILLSAVARTNQRYGPAHIADVVRGSMSQKVTDAGHDQLSVHGLLKDSRKADLVGYLDQLTAAGALVQRGEYGTLAFDERGIPVMKGEDRVQLARPLGASKASAPKRSSPAAAAPLSAEDRELFEQLRALRKQIAEELSVPPYVVFSDATLRALCRARPSSHDQMLEVKGIGPAKLEAFGDRFLEAIASTV